MTNDIFLGRKEEQEQFARMLRLYQPNPIQQHFPTFSKLSKPFIQPPEGESQTLPFVMLLHGEGGMGKSTLIRRLKKIANGALEPTFKHTFNVLFLDWEDKEQSPSSKLQVGHDYVHPEDVLAELYKAIVDSGWRDYFEPYRKLVDRLKGIEAKVDRELRSPPEKDLYAQVRKLGAKTIAWAIRTKAAIVAGPAGAAAVSSPALEPGLETTIQIGTELLDQTKQFVRKILTLEEYEIYKQPHQQLAETLGKNIAELTKRKPLVILLDTYEIVDRPECDYTLRTLIKWGGNRVIWVIAGRANLADSQRRVKEYFRGYKQDFPGDRLYAKALSEFSLSEIQQYFSTVAPERLITETQAVDLARFSLGIPFVINEAAVMWQEGKPLEEILAPVPVPFGGMSPHQHIVRVMSERFLNHCFHERDLKAVYALAMMRRPNAELLQAMLDVEDLERELQSLRERYSFIWVDQVRLDEKLAAFLREYLLEDVRRTSLTVQQVNENAITWLKLHLEKLSLGIADTAEKLEDDRIAEGIADLINHQFWKSEEDGWRYLTPRFVEGWQYDQSWSRTLLKTAGTFQPLFSKDGQRRFNLMLNNVTVSPDLEDTQHLLEELEKLDRRKWFDGEGLAEHKAILLLQRGQLCYRQEHYQESLQFYLEAEKQLSERIAETVLASRDAGSLAQQTVVSSSTSKQRRLEEQRDLFQTEWNLRMKKLEALRKALAVETGVTANFQLQQQIQAEEIELTRLHEKLEPIEQALSSEQIVSNEQVIPNIQIPSKAAAQLRKDLAEAFYILSREFIWREDRNKAAYSAEGEQAIEKAILLDPTQANRFYYLGVIQSQLGRYTEALTSFQTAIQLDPHDAKSNNGLGNVFHKQGNHEEALIAYQQAIKLDPSYANPYNGLANIYYEQRRYDEAIKAFQTSAELDPENAAPCFNLGWIHLAQSEFNKAAERFQQANRLDPKDYSPVFSLGLVYALRSDVEAARQQWQQGLTLCKDNTAIGKVTRALYTVAIGETEQGLNQLKQLLEKEGVAVWVLRNVLEDAELLAKCPIGLNEISQVVKLLKEASIG